MNGSKRNYMIYGTMLAVFGLLMWWVVRMGEAYDTSDVVAVRHADSSVDLLRETLASNLTHPVPLLLLQIIAILVAVRIFSYLFKYLGQPGVIGEIVAGIVLGPSVLGHFFPGAFEFLFEPSSLVPLNVISQIGLVLFMFVIGMELDLGVMRRKASRDARHQPREHHRAVFSRAGARILGLSRVRGASRSFPLFRAVHRHIGQHHGFSRTGPDRAGAQPGQNADGNARDRQRCEQRRDGVVSARGRDRRGQGGRRGRARSIRLP